MHRQQPLAKPFGRSLSKLKKLLRIPDHQGRLGENDSASTSEITTSSTNTASPFAATSLSTIPEMSEPIEYYRINITHLTESLSTTLNNFPQNVVSHGNSNTLSISTFSTACPPSSVASPFHSPSSPTHEQSLNHHKSSYDDLTTSTTSSIFNAYEAEGITDDPALVIAELEMYVPVTRAMVRILLTRSHLFPGHALDATQLALFLEASCEEVATFLVTRDQSNAASVYGSSSSGGLGGFSADIESVDQFYGYNSAGKTAGSERTRIAYIWTKMKPNRNYRPLRDVLRSSKRNLKCGVTSLVLKIPSRGPRWLMDRVLLWTVVGGEYEGSRENLSSSSKGILRDVTGNCVDSGSE